MASAVSVRGTDRMNQTVTARIASAIANGIAERGSRSGARTVPEGPAVSSGTSVSYGAMADGTRITSEQPLSRYGVRLSLRSSLALVFAFAVTVLVLEIALDAERVIAWALTAMAIAALAATGRRVLLAVHGAGLAVLVVVVLILGSFGFVVYRVVDDVSSQTRRLQRAAPERAAELEADSDLLQEIHFADRVERLAKAIPERLRGGSPAEAIRSAANRGVAFLAGLILTLFFVLYGPSLLTGAFGQITDPTRRGRVEHASSRGRGPGPRVRARATAPVRSSKVCSRSRSRAQPTYPARPHSRCGSRSGR